MTVKEGLKVSQQTRVQIKQGECPPAPGSKTSTVGLQFTSKKEQKKKNPPKIKNSHSQYPESETYKKERKKNAVSKTI